MQIGSIRLDNHTVLAPLAGISNLPFRLIAKEAGCGLVCSEMVSATGLVYKSHKTAALLDSSPAEKPLSVQIFGSDPCIMAEAARIVESSGADILDINFGCAVKKITKTGAGVALMKAPARAEAILKAIRKAVSIPLSIKIRTGWETTGRQAFETAVIAEGSGVDAVTVHPRTAGQGFSGTADWSLIAAIKRKISIPVIGNGDIRQPQDAVSIRNKTGCDGVMIGRAAIGNPLIFSQIAALARGEPVSEVPLAQHFELMLRYLDASVRYFGEKQACLMMRSRLGWFAKGLHYSSHFRESIKRINSRNEAVSLILRYQDTLLEGKNAEQVREPSDCAGNIKLWRICR